MSPIFAKLKNFLGNNRLGLVLVGVFLGMAAGVTIEHYYLVKNISIPIVTRINAQGTNYKYIAPLLAYDVDDSGSYTESNGLQDKFNTIINDAKNSGKATDVSVYYRGPSGAWVGINETEEYNPASLFKVPIMIAYFKQAETDPSVLSQEIKFDNPKDQSPPQAIPPSGKIVFGQTYTIEQLIEYMIEYSDNSAANILADRIALNQQDSYTEMLSELGLPADTSQISAKTYSLFLRILRNATYLNSEMSEKALGIMTQSDFKQGLSAGVPTNTDIAQKFGEFGTMQGGQQIEELHNCGIIYAPKIYLLCVMTKGYNVMDLENIIKNISTIAYNEAEK